jgi:S-adenosylmethionine-diacylgycerolhomoserine-N-methlytransferase
MATAMGSQTEDIGQRMDRMYRPQKYIYDLTRKYYLLGRDRLIAELDAKPGQTVLDIGCGTGRNLVLIGQRYPEARLFGLDAAQAMLEIAASKLERAGVRAALARGIAEELDPQGLFGLVDRFDHITISYCLSMVDDPGAAVRAAMRRLAPGGTLHIVDFGDMAGLPSWFRRTMVGWLARFHVRHRPEVADVLRGLADDGGARLEIFAIARRYAMLMRLIRPHPAPELSRWINPEHRDAVAGLVRDDEQGHTDGAAARRDEQHALDAEVANGGTGG